MDETDCATASSFFLSISNTSAAVARTVDPKHACQIQDCRGLRFFLEDPSLKLLVTQEAEIAMVQLAPVTMSTWHTETRGYASLIRSHHSNCGLYTVAAYHPHVQILAQRAQPEERFHKQHTVHSTCFAFLALGGREAKAHMLNIA